jgi:hypothetical protein
MAFSSYLMTKTQYAFTFSCEEFFRVNPKVYFWTFTFKSVPIDDEYAMLDWNTFVKRLVKYHPELWGIRVTELHRSHGIHFHFFINIRVAIDQMRKIVHGSGHLVGYNRYTDFGRMEVQPCDKAPESVAYLACYLTKQYRIQNWFGRRRRWGCMGGFPPSKCSDIEYISTATINREILFGKVQCSYTALMMLTHFSTLWGHVDNWPARDIGLVWGQPDCNGSSVLKHRFNLKDNEEINGIYKIGSGLHTVSDRNGDSVVSSDGRESGGLGCS